MRPVLGRSLPAATTPGGRPARARRRRAAAGARTRTAPPRPALLRTLGGRGAVAGPARPWLEVRASYDRALRARALGHRGRHRGRAHPAGAARRPRGAAPTCAPRCWPRWPGLRPGTAEKLADDAARVAAAPGPPRRRRRRAVRAPADRALPDGPAARAVRRPARRPRRTCWRWWWRWPTSEPGQVWSGPVIPGSSDGLVGQRQGEDGVLDQRVALDLVLEGAQPHGEVGLGVVAGQVDRGHDEELAAARRTPRAGR